MRLDLWQTSFPDQVELAPEIDLMDVSEKYSLAGGTIINVVRYCCLQALANDSTVVSKELLHKGIRREMDKEGRTVR